MRIGGISSHGVTFFVLFWFFSLGIFIVNFSSDSTLTRSNGRALDEIYDEKNNLVLKNEHDKNSAIFFRNWPSFRV